MRHPRGPGFFWTSWTDMIRFLIPNYISGGKEPAGDRHRAAPAANTGSVTLANELYQRLSQDEGYGLKIEHRDIEKDALRGK